MKFPYGMSDFKKIVTQNFYYCDRTDRIPLLENGAYLLFLRPRRFGKSLLLSMLANYYDVAMQDRFGRYHDLNLTRFAVVALGFERLWWEEVQ